MESFRFFFTFIFQQGLIQSSRVKIVGIDHKFYYLFLKKIVSLYTFSCSEKFILLFFSITVLWIFWPLVTLFLSACTQPKTKIKIHGCQGPQATGVGVWEQKKLLINRQRQGQKPVSCVFMWMILGVLVIHGLQIR
jgi:hypothetical protein